MKNYKTVTDAVLLGSTGGERAGEARKMREVFPFLFLILFNFRLIFFEVLSVSLMPSL